MNDQELRSVFDQAAAAYRQIADPLERANKLVELGNEMARAGIDPYVLFQEAISGLQALPATPEGDLALDAAKAARLAAWSLRQASPPAVQDAPVAKKGLLGRLWGALSISAKLALFPLFVGSPALMLMGYLIGGAVGMTLMVVGGGIAALYVWPLVEFIQEALDAIDQAVGRTDTTKGVFGSVGRTFAKGALFLGFIGTIPTTIHQHHPDWFGGFWSKMAFSVTFVAIYGISVISLRNAGERGRRLLDDIEYGTGRTFHHAAKAFLGLGIAAMIVFWLVPGAKMTGEQGKVALGAIIGVVVIASILWAAISIFRMIYNKLDYSGHGGLGAACVAGLATIVVFGVTVKGAAIIGVLGYLQTYAASINIVENKEGISITLTPSAEKTKSSEEVAGVDDVKPAAPATPAPQTEDGAGTKQEKQEEKKVEKPKLTKAQTKAEISKAEATLAKEYGPDVPDLATLQQQERDLAKRLTAINDRYRAEGRQNDVQEDPEYKEVVAEMASLAGKINLRGQIATLQEDLEDKPAPGAQTPAARQQKQEKARDVSLTSAQRLAQRRDFCAAIDPDMCPESCTGRCRGDDNSL